MEMYCSGITTLEAIQVTSVAATSPAPLLTTFVILLIITSSCLVSSMIPPNIIAMMVIKMEEDMFINPPVVSRLSRDSIPVLHTKPFLATLKISPNVAPVCRSSRLSPS